MQDIQIVHLRKAFGDTIVLHDLSMTLPRGSVLALMAPSGAGKTTFLRLLMGSEISDSGEIRGLEGARVSAVFQEDRLLEYMDAVGNIRLVAPKLPESDILQGLSRMMLADHAHKAVRDLSGGMKRRVALLRALMAESDILLLDEPFKGSDEETLRETIKYTRECLRGRTTLLVTHDPLEAELLGARVIHLEEVDHSSP